MIRRYEEPSIPICPLCNCKLEERRDGDMNFFSCEACGYAFARPSAYEEELDPSQLFPLIAE